MSVSRHTVPVTRRGVESVLAVIVFLFAAVWFLELGIIFERSVAPEYLFLPATLVVPGILAVSVLTGVLAHGVRLGSALTGYGDRVRSSDTAPFRILGSLVLGALAAYTLWWAVGSLYVVYLGDPGGVLLHPFVVLGVGSALSTLVLLRAVFYRLFSGGDGSRPGGPFVV